MIKRNNNYEPWIQLFQANFDTVRLLNKCFTKLHDSNKFHTPKPVIAALRYGNEMLFYNPTEKILAKVISNTNVYLP